MIARKETTNSVKIINLRLTSIARNRLNTGFEKMEIIKIIEILNIPMHINPLRV